jgi:4-carboxymuconolactone decarboxylase
MRLSEPRIPPLPEQEWSTDQREILTRTVPAAEVLNIFRTLIRHPDLYRRWLPFGHQILFKSSLPPREREIVILRVGHLCNAEYEFHHHVVIGEDAGLTDEDIQAVQEGPGAGHWDNFERMLVRAVDELHNDAFITQPTWDGLATRYSTTQMIDLVFTVGQYTMVSMALNSLGVQLEAGNKSLPEMTMRTARRD